MGIRTTRRPDARWLLVGAILASTMVATAGKASAAGREKQVLVLHSTRRTSQLVTVSDHEIPRILDGTFPEGVDYYTEFVDEAQFPLHQYELAFRDFLLSKYKGQRFDIIVAMGDNALRFVDDTRLDLFPEAPVVFFATSPSYHRPLNSTGIVARMNLAGSLNLALALQPDVRRVFVVSATDDSNKGYEEEARSQFLRFEPRLKATFLSDLTKPDLEARLARLPRRSIVYFLTYTRHGSDENFRPIEYLDRLAATANAPTYSWVDSAMDHGIVGGSLKSQQIQADAVARLGVRLLHGERADTIAPAVMDLNVNQVDWRQLRRWGISESRVPAGTLVQFRRPTVWDRFKVYIIVCVVVLAAQSALISGLLVQRRRRRHAERSARHGEAALRASYERIRDLGGRLLLAQEEERARVARELHDDVCQQLGLLVFELDLLRREDPRRRKSDRVLASALDIAQGAVKSVHDLSHRLHPARLRLIGLVSAIRGLARELSKPDLVIAFSHESVPEHLPDETALCLFRVVQEALHNVIKHSAATHVSVHLRSEDHGLALTIADNGIGFNVDEARPSGLGLLSMNERLQPIGGHLQIRSSPGAGTLIEVAVPAPARVPGGAYPDVALKAH
jgi:signal transduction histidine kinase